MICDCFYNIVFCMYGTQGKLQRRGSEDPLRRAFVGALLTLRLNVSNCSLLSHCFFRIVSCCPHVHTYKRAAIHLECITYVCPVLNLPGVLFP